MDYVICEATNLDNLALLYEGWTPWVWDVTRKLAARLPSGFPWALVERQRTSCDQVDTKQHRHPNYTCFSGTGFKVLLTSQMFFLSSLENKFMNECLVCNINKTLLFATWSSISVEMLLFILIIKGIVRFGKINKK